MRGGLAVVALEPTGAKRAFLTAARKGDAHRSAARAWHRVWTDSSMIQRELHACSHEEVRVKTPRQPQTSAQLHFVSCATRLENVGALGCIRREGAKNRLRLRAHLTKVTPSGRN